jgi:transposase-like protein
MAVRFQLGLDFRKPRAAVSSNKGRDPFYISPESDAERYHAILEALRTGKSYRRIARRHSTGVNQVRRIAKEAGLTHSPGDRRSRQTAKATAARSAYARERRVLLLDEALAKAEALLPDVDNVYDLDHLISAVAKLIEKRRLEDGKATTRIDARYVAASASLAAKIEQLAVCGNSPFSGATALENWRDYASWFWPKVAISTPC